MHLVPSYGGGEEIRTLETVSRLLSYQIDLNCPICADVTHLCFAVKQSGLTEMDRAD